MGHSGDQSNDDLQFHWGRKRGVGSMDRDCQLYESFTYDNVTYSLYDCVYLFGKGEFELYVGKILKMWEKSRCKRVFILWFFRPNEIRNYLGGHAPLKKEIFLASGEGCGLFNVNPLEAIAGKCCVICTSKDKRNPQPSSEELANADYIFYRTFDVQRLQISEKIPDRIAGVEVKYLLNWRGNQKQFEAVDDGNKKHLDIWRTGAREPNEKVNLNEKKTKPFNESLKKLPAAVPAEGVTKAKVDYQTLEVTRRWDVDRSKWFKERPWEEKIQNADEQGTLVFIGNLDPSYSSSEVEDIICHALKQSCTARIIQQSTFQDPNYGEAYVIFKTKDAADLAVSKINMGCLMLPKGRPLTCSKGMLKVPPQKSSSFTGHLSIDKPGFQLHRERRAAVSTSHCSQPNTIAYELGLDWFYMLEKSNRWFSQLFKAHGDERKEGEKRLKHK